MPKRPFHAIVLSVILTFVPNISSAYLPLGGDRRSGRLTIASWSSTPTYFVANAGAQGVPVDSVVSTVQASFATWSAQTGFTAKYGGLTSAPLDVADGRNVIGFQNLGGTPGFEDTLGFTDFLVVGSNLSLVEVDIVFNSSFPFSTASSGQDGRFDLQSIATHEIGHFLGLDHSAVGLVQSTNGGLGVVAKRTVMFPIAFNPGNISDRVLNPDDIAGMSLVYNTSNGTGSLAGRVLKGGRGVFGAHVVAFNPATGKVVGAFTLDTSGNYTIAGLDPGAYIVRVEPLDDMDVESFFIDLPVDTRFAVAFAKGPAVVASGRQTSGIDVTVSPR